MASVRYVRGLGPPRRTAQAVTARPAATAVRVAVVRNLMSIPVTKGENRMPAPRAGGFAWMLLYVPGRGRGPGWRGRGGAPRLSGPRLASRRGDLPGPTRRRGAHDGCAGTAAARSEEHTSELQSRENLVCRLLLEKKK